MTRLTDRQVDYLLPALNALANNIRVLQNRLDNRPPTEWHSTEFSLVEATAGTISKDAGWISTALGVLGDVERGDY